MNHRLPMMTGAAAGVALTAVESLRPSLTPRSTVHQGLVTGMMTVTGAAVGAVTGKIAAATGLPGSRHVLPVVGLTGVGAFTASRFREHVLWGQVAHPDWEQPSGDLAKGAALAVAGTTAAATAFLGASHGLARLGRGISKHAPGPAPFWTAACLAAIGAAAAGAGTVGLRRVKSELTTAGKAADAALADPPPDPFVSGGPGSLLNYDTLSREGRRYVRWRVNKSDLEAAGHVAPSEPVRVFVGIDSAPSIEQQVDLATAELDRLDAWDRQVLIAVSPAGSGYANSVPVEALEYFVNGSCASVVVQYGVLPSMFSTDKVPAATQTFRLLIDRIHDRIMERPQGSRPKFLIYGESLGARAAELALLQEPALVDLTTASVAKVDAALFVGTPGGPSLRDLLLHHPATVHVDRWQALPDLIPDHVQLWFLEHDADPVTRFSAELVARKPDWLATEPPGRNVPPQMRWLPLLTWQQVLFDVAYATQAQSGVFRSVGHDYRADLGQVVATAFAPESKSQTEHVQMLLAQREVARDAKLVATQASDEGS